MTAPKVPPHDHTTVLVVDDEDGIRQALTRFLTRLGYRVQAAANATEALQQLAAHHPQAMLCDIRMPDTSGVELLPKVLAQDPDLAIIMLTAIDEPRTAIECLKLGAYDYLIKPVDLEELELSLQHALRQRQLEMDRRELEQWLPRRGAGRPPASRDGAHARSRRADARDRKRRARRAGGGARLAGGRRGIEQIGRGVGSAARGAADGAATPARRRLGFRGFRLFLARLAASHAAERADQTDECPAVRARIAFRSPLLVPAGAAHHPVMLLQLRLFHDP